MKKYVKVFEMFVVTRELMKNAWERIYREEYSHYVALKKINVKHELEVKHCPK